MRQTFPGFVNYGTPYVEGKYFRASGTIIAHYSHRCWKCDCLSYPAERNTENWLKLVETGWRITRHGPECPEHSGFESEWKSLP